VAGFAEVARQLEGEPAARADLGGECRQELEVPGDPLQRRVGDQDVDRVGLGYPLAQVGDLELDARVDRAGAVDHLRAGVEATDPGPGPARSQQGGEVARAASEVHDLGGPLGADSGHQLDERPAPLVGVGQVALGVPGVWHVAPRECLDVEISSVSIGHLDVKILDSI